MSMKIVVLDGYTLNPGDLGWEGLKELGELQVYDRTPKDLILQRAADAEILFTNKTPLTAETLCQLKNLKYIGVLATGYDVVDLQAAKAQGIVVTNIPSYGMASVAQMVFALLLELCHHVQNHSDQVKKGAWSKSEDFCFWNYPLIELAGKTLGVIGFGRIGQQVARIGLAFGMQIMAYDKYRSANIDLDFTWAELPELFAEADVITLHCPLFPENRGLINQANLVTMKKTAFLINTSRGGLVLDTDLADALNNGNIAGAGLDVLSVEPPAGDNPLLSAKNCLITPHISWATKEARSRLMDTAVSNLQGYLQGAPINVIKG